MNKKMLNMAMAAAVVLGTVGVGVAGSAPAQADPAGAYYYTCVMPTGLQYTTGSGKTAHTCSGQLLIYINGKQIASINQAKAKVHPTLKCVVHGGIVAAEIATDTPIGWALAAADFLLVGDSCIK